MNHIDVFLQNNAFNMKAGMLMLELSSAPCFIDMLQLIIKDSFFSEKNISVLIAKACQTISHFISFFYRVQETKKI